MTDDASEDFEPTFILAHGGAVAGPLFPQCQPQPHVEANQVGFFLSDCEAAGSEGRTSQMEKQTPKEWELYHS